MEYAWLLMDPRWQKRRLEIFERDEFTCTKCGDSYSTLHVHHFYYNYDLQPWEYPAEALTTYCDLCHQKAHFFIWFRKVGSKVLAEQFFLPSEILNISNSIITELNKKTKESAIRYMDDIKRLVHG